MFAFLLVVHAIIAAVLVTFILMQKSEGGGLGMGGSPSGLMSARGAADFLTRGTAVLATVFVTMSIALAFYAASRRTETVDASLARPVQGAPAAPPIRPTAPIQADDAPFAGAAGAAAGNTPPLPADNSQTQLP